jgi:hypothetical protein
LTYVEHVYYYLGVSKADASLKVASWFSALRYIYGVAADQ